MLPKAFVLFYFSRQQIMCSTSSTVIILFLGIGKSRRRLSYMQEFFLLTQQLKFALYYNCFTKTRPKNVLFYSVGIYFSSPFNYRTLEAHTFSYTTTNLEFSLSPFSCQFTTKTIFYICFIFATNFTILSHICHAIEINVLLYLFCLYYVWFQHNYQYDLFICHSPFQMN